MIRSAAAAIVVLAMPLALSSCDHRAAVGVAAPGAFDSIRQYGWDLPVADPEPEWAPSSDRVVARTNGGFLALEENTTTRSQQKFSSAENRETHFPVWINESEVVFGPGHNVDKLSDGRVVPASEGLTVVTLGAVPVQKQLYKYGYRPRVGQRHVFAQGGDKILELDEHGQPDEFGVGFYAEPQADGPGIAWQETPVFDTDFWTGKPVRSNLVIRWRPGKIDLLPAAVQARWASDGALVATVLHGDPQTGHAWYEGGTDVVLVPSPGKAPIVLEAGARDPSPNPVQPVVAVTGSNGHIAIVSRTGAPRLEFAEGHHPLWNHDGTRLLFEEGPESPAITASVDADGAAAPRRSGSRLTVVVFAIRAAATK